MAQLRPLAAEYGVALRLVFPLPPEQLPVPEAPTEAKARPGVMAIGDPARTLARAFGLGRSSYLQFFSPSVLTGFVRALAHGNVPGRLKGDLFAQPGTFVVSAKGAITFAYRGRDAADRPTPEAVGAALASVAAR